MEGKRDYKKYLGLPNSFAPKDVDLMKEFWSNFQNVCRFYSYALDFYEQQESKCAISAIFLDWLIWLSSVAHSIQIFVQFVTSVDATFPKKQHIKSDLCVVCWFLNKREYNHHGKMWEPLIIQQIISCHSMLLVKPTLTTKRSLDLLIWGYLFNDHGTYHKSTNLVGLKGI